MGSTIRVVDFIKIKIHDMKMRFKKKINKLKEIIQVNKIYGISTSRNVVIQCLIELSVSYI